MKVESTSQSQQLSATTQVKSKPKAEQPNAQEVAEKKRQMDAEDPITKKLQQAQQIDMTA